MSKAGSGLRAVVLENQNIPEPLILGQVVHPVTVRPQELLDLLRIWSGL